RSLELSADERSLWVVNTESDSISEIDLIARKLKREVHLGPPPSVDPVSGRFEPRIRLRALAIDHPRGKIYVAGQSANRLLIVDEASGVLTSSIAVDAEPVSVLTSPDGAFVFVVNHQSATVQKIDATTDRVVATTRVSEHPWGASLRADG